MLPWAHMFAIIVNVICTIVACTQHDYNPLVFYTIAMIATLTYIVNMFFFHWSREYVRGFGVELVEEVEMVEYEDIEETDMMTKLKSALKF